MATVRKHFLVRGQDLSIRSSTAAPRESPQDTEYASSLCHCWPTPSLPHPQVHLAEMHSCQRAGRSAVIGHQLQAKPEGPKGQGAALSSLLGRRDLPVPPDPQLKDTTCSSGLLAGISQHLPAAPTTSTALACPCHSLFPPSPCPLPSPSLLLGTPVKSPRASMLFQRRVSVFSGACSHRPVRSGQGNLSPKALNDIQWVRRHSGFHFTQLPCARSWGSTGRQNTPLTPEADLDVQTVQ